jgi:hypothetical protein
MNILEALGCSDTEGAGKEGAEDDCKDVIGKKFDFEKP